MTRPRLELSRAQILAYRRTVGALDERLPPGPRSLQMAAWAGLQDSMPRAALLSIHARVHGTGPSTWEDPSLVQLWGPRYSAYIVAAADRSVFSLGRLPDDANGRRRAEDLADRLHAFLGGRAMTYGEAGRGLGEHPNRLRYAAPTGTLLVRWDGARQPLVWTVPPPAVSPRDARLELARRYLHVFGPGTPAGFAGWAGIAPARGLAAFEAIVDTLAAVRTPVGEAWILSRDEPTFVAPGRPPATARLLPSGDAYFLLQGADRELLVPEADCRRALWTPRVWPGGLLVSGDLAGTLCRADANVTIQPWRSLSRAERDAVEAETETFPLPGVRGRIVVRWDERDDASAVAARPIRRMTRALSRSCSIRCSVRALRGPRSRERSSWHGPRNRCVARARAEQGTGRRLGRLRRAAATRGDQACSLPHPGARPRAPRPYSDRPRWSGASRSPWRCRRV